MKLDIKEVGAVQQDFTNLTIRVLSKQGYPMWERGYKLEETFNKKFREINKLFNAELKRREAENENR